MRTGPTRLRFNSDKSSVIKLIGGFPEGSLVGQDAFIEASNDSASTTEPEDWLKYIDDLEISELINLAGLLIDYDCMSHVPSDVAVEHNFLPQQATKTQGYLDSIQSWTSKTSYG